MDKPFPKPLRWLKKYAFKSSILTIAVVVPLGIYFGPQTVTYYELRPILLGPLDLPPRGWTCVPRGPITDTSVSSAAGTNISFHGYKFEVPWKGVEREGDLGHYIEVVFKSRQVLRLYNPEWDRNPIDSYTSHLNQDDVKLAFGSGVQESKYDRYRAVISTTPLQLSPFLSHREFARTRVLLEIKGLWFEHSPVAPEVFSFATKEYRGFEIKGTSPEGQYVLLELFDRTDQHWFTITIVDGEGDFTQPEINRIIDSFGTAPSADGALK